MTEQEINQICDRCNGYIKEHYQGRVCTYAEMYHVVNDDETVRLNGCSKEWAICGIKQAIVEVTSPTTSTRSVGCSIKSFSNATMMAAVCSACVPPPHPKLTSGLGMLSSSKKVSLICRS